MNILFVCSMARLRSKTASEIYEGNSKYAGTDQDSDKPITKELMDWSDRIICMEMCHRSRLRRKFKGYSKKMQVLNIPDDFDYMNPVLVEILNHKFKTRLFA